MKKYRAFVNDIQDDMEFEVDGTVEEIKQEIVNNLGLLSEDQFETLLNETFIERSHINVNLQEI